MVLNCDCIGCKNIAKYRQPQKPNRGPCVPTDFRDIRRSDRENDVNGFNVNCIPRQNMNKTYDRDVKTSDLYRTKNIPERFERSCSLNGYGNQYKKYDPVFHTTNSEYGWQPPNAHTVPHRYHPRTIEFSSLLAKSGMYRNYSLNTVMDKSRV